MSIEREPTRAAGVLACLFLFASTAGAQTSQFWGEIDLASQWRTVGFTVPMVVRMDSHLPNPQFLAAGLTADLPLPWQLTLTGGYLFVDLPQRPQPHVHVPLLALSRSFHIGRVTLADRNRFEKLMGLSASPVRYRNRVTVNLPLGPRDRWHVFIDDEAFFDFSTSHWTQNRFQVGGGPRLTPHVRVEVFYLQRNARGVPATRVIGATLGIALTRRPGSDP